MKNCLAVFGLVFLVLILGAVILGVMVFMDQPVNFESGIPTIQVNPSPGNSGGSVIDRQYPLEGAPLPTTRIETLLPTATTLPDPVVYKTTVLLRARSFGAYLDEFMTLNQELQEDPALLSDPAWQTEVRTTLDLFVGSARDLSNTGTVPTEYQAIHQWLVQVGPEAEALRNNYIQGMEQGDQAYLQAAAENMSRIVELMSKAEVAMVQSGWEN